jgi:hypothetical protein
MSNFIIFPLATSWNENSADNYPMWFDSDGKTPVYFPYSLGNFENIGEPAGHPLYLFTNTCSISDVELFIDPVPGTAYQAWSLAKGLYGRPMLYNDYMRPLQWPQLTAYTWYQIWIKFNPELATGNPNNINLRLTGDLISQ